MQSIAIEKGPTSSQSLNVSGNSVDALGGPGFVRAEPEGHKRDAPGACLTHGRDKARPSRNGYTFSNNDAIERIKKYRAALGGPGFVRAEPEGHKRDAPGACLAHGRDEARPSHPPSSYLH